MLSNRHTDTQTDTQTHRPSTVTLAAHARRGLTRVQIHVGIFMQTPLFWAEWCLSTKTTYMCKYGYSNKSEITFTHCYLYTCSLETLNPYITKSLKYVSIFRSALINIDHLPVSVSSAASCSITSLWSKSAMY